MRKTLLSATMALLVVVFIAPQGHADNWCGAEARVDAVNERGEIRASNGCHYAYIYGRYNDGAGNQYFTSAKTKNPLYHGITLRVQAPTGYNMNAYAGCTHTNTTICTTSGLKGNTSWSTSF